MFLVLDVYGEFDDSKINMPIIQANGTNSSTLKENTANSMEICASIQGKNYTKST